ncbi:TonB-linked outer membrane protein, SusC/RagA family [Parapedobacter composti]|uniref:TonB-linked outer membrane protein, SusC/RagA family n=1 Tax=Parapedobacter composti TaxID=623281 RepID=A0A1I1I4R9_9SPHI|nr:TonB-dependent receptor [Parapedobacter composti]SFC28190.1 TonB-linked outer membrane protein, SusC/RagA family [Parapedobacter composti]
MRYYVLLIFTLLIASHKSYGQGVVSGTVIDQATQRGIAGVNVSVKETGVTAQTDDAGRYRLQLPQGRSEVTLVFRYMGYRAQEKTAAEGQTVDVALEVEESLLEEAVAIGYSTVSRRDLTSAVSSVNARQLKDIPLSSAAEAITGRLAGVRVVTTEGAPGAEVQIRVRGGGSITQDNSPLYIVDGIQVENALSILSPQEIESIDVLKDAASTAIYGARGANGVVIITTKGGMDMKTQVTYNGFGGVRTITNRLNVMQPYDYVRYQYQAYNLNTDEQTRNAFRDRYGRWEDLELYRDMPFVDWQDAVFGRHARNQSHIVGLVGGTDKTSFNFNLNHTDEEGIMLNSGFQRTLASLKFTHKASNRLDIGFNARYSKQQVDGVGTSSTGTQSSNRLRNAVRFMPFIAPGMEAIVDEFDPEFANQTNLVNPVVLANDEIRNQYRDDIIFNGNARFKLTDELIASSNFGIHHTVRKDNRFAGVSTGVARQNNNQPVVNLGNGESFALTNSNTLTYRKKFGEHRVQAMLGHEIYQIQNKNQAMEVKWLPVDISPKEAFAGIQKAIPGDGMIQTPPSTNWSEHRLFSLFGQFNYSYGDRYMATVTLRRDGSSLFAKENRNAFFPSMAVAWRASEESFMEGTRDWLSDLKLRLSYGAVGNNRIGIDLYKTMFGVHNNYSYAYGESITPGFAPLSLANSDLRWETTISRNVGLDFAVLNGRISGSVDLYQNSTKDLLLQARVPATSGYATQLKNIGETENRGLEIQLAGTVVQSRNFTYQSQFNISFNRNKIVSLGLDSEGRPLASYLERAGWVSSQFEDFIVQVGSPIGQFYGYVTDGFYTLDDFDYNPNNQTYTLKAGVPSTRNVALGNRDPQPGDLKLKKLSDDGEQMINATDRTILGNAQPKFIGGMNHQFAYKNFDLSIFLNWSVGNKVYNANKIEFTTQYLYRDNNMLTTMNDRWRWFDDNGVRVTDPETLAAMNANTTMWTPPGGPYFLHSYAIEDGSFLRISNLTLGYSLPHDILRRTRVFSNVRIYATVNNLWTITGYSGYDPEANTRRNNPLTPAVDYAAYPRSRYMLAGINVTF